MKNIIEVKDLCKTYINNQRQIHILKNISFFIKQGEFISIMGPSGSGKSTLLYSISGMEKINSGSINFDNINISNCNEIKLSEIRLNEMGFVFQQNNLLKNLDILDNIILPAYMSKKNDRGKINDFALELMKKTTISHLAKNNINQVSGGELQRASICRALINKPKIIFADEPTGALNSKTANEVIDIFQNINEQGTTIMMVTHDVKIASFSERILYMIDGKIKGEYIFGKYKNKEDLKQREIKLSKWLFEKGW